MLIAESPAEFFAENKNIAGFDNVSFVRLVSWFRFRFSSPTCLIYLPAESPPASNECWTYLQPGKSLYTTVRELVENSLDSAESISELPAVEITM